MFAGRRDRQRGPLLPSVDLLLSDFACWLLHPTFSSVTMLSWEEVSKHNSIDSCWVVIRGILYDVTAFLDDHPGGARSILRYGGKDGT